MKIRINVIARVAFTTMEKIYYAYLVMLRGFTFLHKISKILI